MDLLRLAYENWAASDAWTLVPPPGWEEVRGGVRPGVEWFSLWQGDVVIRDGLAHVRGGLEQAMGHDVGDGRWLEVDAGAWLRRGHDHSAIGMLGKSVRNELGHPGVVVGERDGLTELQVRELRVTVDATPRVVAFTDELGRFEVHYGPEPELAVPVVDPATVVRPADMPVRRRRRSGQVTVVVEPDEGGRWSVRSDDLAGALGVSGPEADDVALQHLAREAPHLLSRVELDSYDTVVSAYADDEQTARELATQLGRLVGH